MSEERTNWAELIKDNYDELADTMKQACRQSLANTCSVFTVILENDGNIYIYNEDPAGSHSIPSTVWNGEAIEIESYDSQFYDPKNEDDNFWESLMDELSDEEREELYEIEEENPLMDRLEIILDEFPDAYERYKANYEDWYIDECVTESIDNTLCGLIEYYEQIEHELTEHYQE